MNPHPDPHPHWDFFLDPHPHFFDADPQHWLPYSPNLNLLDFDTRRVLQEKAQATPYSKGRSSISLMVEIRRLLAVTLLFVRTFRQPPSQLRRLRWHRLWRRCLRLCRRWRLRLRRRPGLYIFLPTHPGWSADFASKIVMKLKTANVGTAGTILNETKL